MLAKSGQLRNWTLVSGETTLDNRLPPLNWTDAIFQVIDFGSFSSLWYWIVVAVAWSTASHFVLGVPYDLIQRAKRVGGDAEDDVVDLARLSVKRQLNIASMAGVWLLGFACFLLTTLFVLGVWYEIELALAVLLLALPMTILGAIRLSTCRLIAAENPEYPDLLRILTRHRIVTQVIGMFAIFITAMVGMFHNLAALYSF